jgi:hypothetical protein
VLIYKLQHKLNILANNNNNNPFRYGYGETWPAEQPPLAVFPDCTKRYWVDMWSARRIAQQHFQLSKPDRDFFSQVTTQPYRTKNKHERSNTNIQDNKIPH